MAENLSHFNLVACKRFRRQSLTPSPPPKSFRRVPLAEIKNQSVSRGGDDDVFNEAFFQEFDAICEERSGVKIPRESKEGATNDGGLDFLGFWDGDSEKVVEKSAVNCDFVGFRDRNSERVVEKSAMNDRDFSGLLDRNSERRVVNDRNGGFVGLRDGNSERETDDIVINCGGGFDRNEDFVGFRNRNSERETEESVMDCGGFDWNEDFLGFRDRNLEREAEESVVNDGVCDGNGDFLGFLPKNSENAAMNDGGIDENEDVLGFLAENSERTAQVSVLRDDVSKNSMSLNEESAVKSDIFDWSEEVSGFSARNSERVAEESLVNIGGFAWDEEVFGLSTPETVVKESAVSGGHFDGNEAVVGFSTKKPESAAEESVVSGGLDGAGVEGMPGKYLEYFQKLNDAQREAACSDVSVPLMIVAGPGSGKTSTMVGRVLTFLKEGIGPSNILAMTFTTAAASEMRDRIGAVVGKAIAKEILISTFHSFCLKLCREHAEKLARTSEFLIYGHGQQRKATIEALRLVENGQEHREKKGNSAPRIYDDILKSFKEKSKKWQKFVTQAKASGRTPEECEKLGDDVGALILRHYGEILASCNALDYHDLISSSVKLLSDFPDVYLECQDKWKAIVVDEFQDTSSMQYCLLRILSSHKRVTIVGDEDQSIFSFNGANCCGFDSFRRDFPTHKEIKLTKNYRSTRYIVEAASALICNNKKRCYFKQVEADNSSGCKIVVKECHSEEAQCAFVTDKILEITGDKSVTGRSFGNVAVLYRRQVSGKTFQVCFRDRKIPFNTHGVAFYRKKVIKAIMALLRTTLPDCDDGPYRQAFKALLPGDKEEKKKMIDYVERICSARKCNFLSAATDIFSAKVSGTFKRAQLTQGRKVLSMFDMLTKLVRREQSISMVISAVANMLPQKYLFEQRAVVDVEGGKLLNEDNDLRSVLQYLMDDVSEFLSTHSIKEEEIRNEEKGCVFTLNAFIDFISLRESENFRSRRQDNDNSVTLTTIHQSKGLEWDTVFIVKANDNEIPLLHEFNGAAEEGGTTVEEERRLLYVAITRAKRELYILYLTVDSNWQLLQPSRFLKEIPVHLLDIQGHAISKETALQPARDLPFNPLQSEPSPVEVYVRKKTEVDSSVEISDPGLSINSNFLKRFNVEDRSIVSHLFHQWAKRPAFQQSNRLLGKISFVIDERLRNKTYKNKDIMRLLKSCLKDEEAFQYAEYIIKWEQIPVEQRAHLMKEKQEHFQRQRIENSMGSAEATSKQIAYLHKLGCTVVPTSRLHASRLIEQYKTL